VRYRGAQGQHQGGTVSSSTEFQSAPPHSPIGKHKPSTSKGGKVPASSGGKGREKKDRRPGNRGRVHQFRESGKPISNRFRHLLEALSTADVSKEPRHWQGAKKQSARGGNHLGFRKAVPVSKIATFAMKGFSSVGGTENRGFSAWGWVGGWGGATGGGGRGGGDKTSRVVYP